MVLNILISTIDKRIDQTKDVLLNPLGEISYIVSHQYTNDKYKYIPDELNRPDVVVSHLPGKGVTKSRNNAIELATGDIGLFADDDVKYTVNDVKKVLDTFTKHPEVDVAIFKIKTPEGEPAYKKYPDTPLKLKKLPFAVGTIEIAIRTNNVKKRNIKFDERFGAGQDILIGGDENIFIQDCIKSGLNVWFYPLEIVEHPYLSTIRTISKYDKKKVFLRGACDGRINGWISIPKALTNTIKILPDLIMHNKNPWTYFYERLMASLYILLEKPGIKCMLLKWMMKK